MYGLDGPLAVAPGKGLDDSGVFGQRDLLLVGHIRISFEEWVEDDGIVQ